MACLVLPAAAQAQVFDFDGAEIPSRPARLSTQRSAFARDRNVAVQDRSFPAFAAQPLALGVFDIFPSLSVAAGATSNVFANNANRHGDLAAVVNPELSVRTRGGPIDVDLHGTAKIKRFRKFQSENTEEPSATIDLAADVGPLSRLYGSASIARRVLARSASDSPPDAAKPLEYRDLSGYFGGSLEGGRTRIAAQVDGRQLRFGSTPRLGGGTIVTQDRDRDVMSAIARVERAIKPNVSVYIAVSGNTVDYRLAPPRVTLQRDSRGWGIYAGASFELSGFLSGDFRIGRLRQSFRAAGAPAVQGLGLKGKLQYFPTRLTTVTLNAERAVRDSGVPGSAGLIHAGAELRIDHELRRYLMLGVIAGRSRDKFIALPRIDHETFAGIKARYLGAKHWRADVGYQYSRRSSLGINSSPNFDEHRAMATLTFQY